MLVIIRIEEYTTVGGIPNSGLFFVNLDFHVVDPVGEDTSVFLSLLDFRTNIPA